MSDDNPLWYLETEDDVPPGPILSAAAIAYSVAADVYLLPGRLFDAAACALASRNGLARDRADPRG